MFSFAELEKTGHEQVVLCHHTDSNLKAIIAIHNTTLGPALGGCRMFPYASDQDALTDVLRLSKAMTYKAAVSGLNLGGGKAVIIGDAKKDKKEALFRSFGRFVETLGGRYITAEDVGTDVNDMEHVFMETDYVVGVEKAHGGSGDPAPFTAYGVFQGIRACVKAKLGKDRLEGVSVAVQGLGSVGSHLVRYLIEDKAKVFVTDIDVAKCEKVQSLYEAEVVKTEEIFSVPADVFAPCAMGGVINDKTVEQLKVKIVAGAANNQLHESRHGDILHQRGILYAPDYAINAGGLMNVYVELEGYSKERATRMTRGVHNTIEAIIRTAKNENIPTYKAADRVAEERLRVLSSVKDNFLGFNARREARMSRRIERS
jgi:leucine dehydrogenase